MQIEEEVVYSHHVPREYLRAWAVGERIWWSGYGRIQQSGLTVVGGENYFYRLEDLCPEDISHLKQLMKGFSVASQPSCDVFLRAFTLPPTILRNQDLIMNATPEEILALERAITNTAEKYHTEVENIFWPYLYAMRSGDASFYQDAGSAAEFLYALSLQYLRTKKIRESVLSINQWLFRNMAGVWNVLSQMLAVTMGAELFQSREQFRIVLIDNDTNVPFITGDQPIVNVLSDPRSSDAPKKMEWYYPLSPSKAMLFLEEANAQFAGRTKITDDEADELNRQIAAHSYKQIFASLEASLSRMHDNGWVPGDSPKARRARQSNTSN